MHPLLTELLATEAVIADGAYGTTLQAEGAPVELLNLTRPEAVLALAHAYVDAGAEVLWSNTFGLSLPGLLEAPRRDEALRRGIELAREAGGGRVPVLAALGPLGKGENPSQYPRMADVAMAAGACGIVLETQTSAVEAQKAVVALRRAGHGVLLSFTLKTREDGTLATPCGTSLLDAAHAVEDAGALAIGVNCCDGPQTVLGAVRELHGKVSVPVFARPNTAVPNAVSAAEFAVYGRALRAAGAWLIGGCCGAGPEHIRALLP